MAGEESDKFGASKRIEEGLTLKNGVVTPFTELDNTQKHVSYYLCGKQHYSNTLLFIFYFI